MTDETPTAERAARAPFADVPVRALVRDVVAVIALLVGLALPWTATERGSDRLEILLTTVLAVAAVALPYARRAQLLTGSWAADERRTRLVGLAPVAIVAVLFLVFDVLPGAGGGVGAGLGLGLAGAVLAAEVTWRRDVSIVAAIIALGAVATPIVVATSVETKVLAVVALAVTAVLVLALLWLTAGRYARGDEAAGVLLLAIGTVLAVGAALVGGVDGARWIGSVHGPWFGFTLLPVLAAVAAPRVVGQQGAAAQPRLWVDVAVKALEVGALLGAYTAVMAVIALSSSSRGIVESVLRLILGVVVAVVLVLARRSLRADLAAGHASAVGAVVVVAVVGCILLAVRAGVNTAASPTDWLLAFGAPATVLAVLLVPRSVRELREQAPAPVSGTPETADVDGQQVTTPTARTYPPAMAGGTGGVTMSAAAGETTILAPVVASPAAPVEPLTPVTPVTPVAPADPRTAEDPRTSEASSEAAPEASASITGPFGVVGATEVMPAISDAPTASGWSVSQALDPATPLADLAQMVAEAPELRRYVAANPSTYPALLDWLGALGDPEVDVALRTRR